MPNEFSENLVKLYQSMAKPMLDLAELNITTLNNIAKSTGSFEEISQNKKPEDRLATHVKLSNAALRESATYSQKAMEIGFGGLTEAGKIWAETLTKASTKATDYAKAASTMGGKVRE